jgi:hypothetical protein
MSPTHDKALDPPDVFRYVALFCTINYIKINWRIVIMVEN